MEKYCCFICPSRDYTEKNLTDFCPNCGLQYGFPLDKGYLPKKIGEWEVIRPLSRGFYSSTYIVEKTSLLRTKKMVLKVVPHKVYEFFEKNFMNECKLHAEVAEGTNHIVNIEDVFDCDILFGEKILQCHVAVLDFVEGETLKSLLENDLPLKASFVGQIAIDLLKILFELKIKETFHNDLHPGNIIIQHLSGDNKRLGEIDDSIKAIAIDFGSLDDRSLSGGLIERKGDLHCIAQILNNLSQKILDNPHNSEERDYRLASLLEERAHIIFPRITSQRIYEFEEIITQIRNAFIQVDSPWRQTLSLRNFKDSYNAQTLAPWFVPSLLVDDDDKWISEISNRGPQVITGMRGCGKTMLIRALQFHARAIPRDNEETRDTNKILKRIAKEDYLGLYVSCTRLLDRLGAQEQPLHEPFTRLYVAYALEGINALRHLRELERASVNIDAFNNIALSVSDYVLGAEDLRKLNDEHDIERYLKSILNSLSKGEKKFTINANPANAFPVLANTISKCSTIWNNHYVFFLLDDVSTRFLNDKNIISLVSSLLFQNEFCSFKFTTEAQTLEMVIHSPGNIEPARIGRDYNVFDLGQEVNEKIHLNKRQGIEFVEKILFKRAQFHSSHPKNVRPSVILGDTSLQTIAYNIAKLGKASEKKGLYHGITAIASVCVGDIGDIITLYEMILKKRKEEYLVPSSDQNECYLELCNSRLFDINRRESRLFDFAESFAEAAHYLLVQSYKQSKNDLKIRLRQYASIFINITTGDIEKQYKQVRELIDAGIFNFSGGPQASRTNRQGINPQQQFKLVYRKLYGINKHIGLSQSDRFELSGKALEDWLNNPKKGKEILIRNLKSGSEHDDLTTEFQEIDTSEKTIPDQGYQRTLFDGIYEQEFDDNEEVTIIKEIARKKTPTSYRVSFGDIRLSGFSEILIGLGFEERTLESLKRIVKIKPKKAYLIKFREEGKTKEILKLLHSFSVNTVELGYNETSNIQELISKNILFDITGLPKSIIFNVVHKSLIDNNKVVLAYTGAKQYYPLDNEIEKLLIKHEQNDYTQFLESLTDILKGERGGYNLIPLLPKETNPGARRVLIAFSSPKHERLYKLLDEREYDKIHIIVPTGNSPRSKLARIAAQVALRKFNHAEITEFSTDNLQDLMEYLSLQYQNYFVNNNYSFEMAITGSKIQTVAVASICAVYKVSQCWYAQPLEWDPAKFTVGTGETSLIEINLTEDNGRLH